MKVVIKKEIETCDQCDFAKIEKVYTSDSFDNVRSIFCKKSNKQVYGYLDWNDKSNIPDDCLFRILETQTIFEGCGL